ncbi:MAG: Cof-type HAD-IIB family hydrolase [Lachnospiraceae bacterium]
MEEKIRLIGLDLDGTVFNDKKEITLPVKKAIKAAIEAGIIVLPATGRPQSGIAKEFLEIPGVRYALSSNGAVVRDFVTGETLYECYLDEALVLELISFFRARNSTLEIYLGGEAYTDISSASRWESLIPNPYIRAYVKNTRIVVNSLNEWYQKSSKKVEKINASFGTIEEKMEAVEQLRHRTDLLMTSGIPSTIEINAVGADKGEALLRMGERLDIPREAIGCCGDGTNDMSMVQKVGFGVAMGNAVPEVKAAAKYITKTNEEDGVAILLEKLMEQMDNKEAGR